jgi:hypothetical protein
MEAKKTRPFKPKTPSQYSTSIEVEELQDFEVVELGGESSDRNFYVNHKVQGQQRRMKKCKVQKMCFACSNKSYCRHMGATMMKKA